MANLISLIEREDTSLEDNQQNSSSSDEDDDVTAKDSSGTSSSNLVELVEEIPLAEEEVDATETSKNSDENDVTSKDSPETSSFNLVEELKEESSSVSAEQEIDTTETSTQPTAHPRVDCGSLPTSPEEDELMDISNRLEVNVAIPHHAQGLRYRTTDFQPEQNLASGFNPVTVELNLANEPEPEIYNEIVIAHDPNADILFYQNYDAVIRFGQNYDADIRFGQNYDADIRFGQNDEDSDPEMEFYSEFQ